MYVINDFFEILGYFMYLKKNWILRMVFKCVYLSLFCLFLMWVCNVIFKKCNLSLNYYMRCGIYLKLYLK